MKKGLIRSSFGLLLIDGLRALRGKIQGRESVAAEDPEIGEDAGSISDQYGENYGNADEK